MYYTVVKFFLASILTIVMSGKVLASNVEHHTKLWTRMAVTGPFTSNPKVLYYFDSQLDFEDDKYKFEQAHVSAGVGYKALPTVYLYLVNSYVVSERHNGVINQEYRLWQQADWRLNNSSCCHVVSRTRFEESKNFDEPQIAVRLRQRILLRLPFTNWINHSLVFFDEVFFNLNRPQWITQKFFDQNRAFIGIGTQLSETAELDIGYINQYQFTTPRQMSNVLYINLNFSY